MSSRKSYTPARCVSSAFHLRIILVVPCTQTRVPTDRATLQPQEGNTWRQAYLRQRLRDVETHPHAPLQEASVFGWVGLCCPVELPWEQEACSASPISQFMPAADLSMASGKFTCPWPPRGTVSHTSPCVPFLAQHRTLDVLELLNKYLLQWSLKESALSHKPEYLILPLFPLCFISNHQIMAPKPTERISKPSCL